MKTFAGILAMLLAALLPTGATAGFNQSQHLNARGQAKVNKAIARGQMQSGEVSGQERLQGQSQVNIGSRRDGNCTMNVGTTNPGDKGKKEVIVTSKEIINVCK